MEAVGKGAGLERVHREGAVHISRTKEKTLRVRDGSAYRVLGGVGRAASNLDYLLCRYKVT